MESNTQSSILELSLEEKIGQLFFPAAFINDSDESIAALEKLIQDYSIGGLTFFHSRAMAATNYEKRKEIPKNDYSYDRLKELIDHFQSVSKYPLIISIDAEWGLAMRVENSVQYPYPLTLGAISDPYLVYEVGEAIGKDLKEIGIHLNLAPVFDVNSNPSNPVIGYRSFGEDKDRVADLAAAYYRGMKSVGVYGCAKHFPGHGNTSVDSHLSLPVINVPEDDFVNEEIRPFVKAIECKIDVIMMGHLAIPSITGSVHQPASLSKVVVTDLLKGQLGFEGIVMTDALNMHAVSNMYPLPGRLELEAFNAGNDILSFSSHIPEAVALIAKEVSLERIEESFTKVSKMKDGIYINISNKSTEPLSEREIVQLKDKLASQCLTEIKSGSSLSNIGLDRTACLVVNKSSEASLFARHISSIKTMPIYELSSEAAFGNIEDSLSQYDKLIIGFYVPNIKPANKFGLSQKTRDWLSKMGKTKATQLVIFGNPYALQYIDYDQSERALLAYQDLSEFEKKAAEAVFGISAIKGSLPITL